MLFAVGGLVDAFRSLRQSPNLQSPQRSVERARWHWGSRTSTALAKVWATHERRVRPLPTMWELQNDCTARAMTSRLPQNRFVRGAALLAEPRQLCCAYTVALILCPHAWMSWRYPWSCSTGYGRCCYVCTLQPPTLSPGARPVSRAESRGARRFSRPARPSSCRSPGGWARSGGWAGRAIVSLRYHDKGKSNRQCGRETPNLGGGCSQGAILCIFSFGRRRTGQDGGMFTQSLYPTVCAPVGGLLGGGKSQPTPP